MGERKPDKPAATSPRRSPDQVLREVGGFRVKRRPPDGEAVWEWRGIEYTESQAHEALRRRINALATPRGRKKRGS